MKFSKIVICSVFLICSGCASAKFIEKPLNGYDAIRFNRTVVLRDHAVNDFIFQANTILINDRIVEDPYIELYCGSVVINDGASHYCLAIEDPDILIINVNGGFKEVRRRVPENTFSHIKIE